MQSIEDWLGATQSSMQSIEDWVATHIGTQQGAPIWVAPNKIIKRSILVGATQSYI
jgi:hypothetical protein